MVVLLSLAVALGGCGGNETGAGGPETGVPTTTGSSQATPTAADPSASDKKGELGIPEQVRATANVFSAGRDELAQPGGGGGGGFPPVWELPPGSDRVVTFPSVTGEVNPIVNQVDYNGPEGDGRGPTDVNSYEGISGLVHGGNGMFLAGVFLTDEPPSEPSPKRLDFTDNDDFEELAPEIGQTFFIGDGQGHSYRVPAAATRLFLGFIDAGLFQGDPGSYNNNAGELMVTVEVAGE
jgi:hypothetical protein